MPLQDYHCKQCNKIFEIIVPLSKNDKEIKCPYCKQTLRKRISAPKIIKIS
ncbi:zinc ribbon domain-containing protein [candidate division WOR-3 bacterium]|nr:zinc ribbon domain-containing protein [candidate division WOR-3 bacterium]